jgi:putative flippase GtrA
MKLFEQAFKFGIVGVGNTLLTLIIIWVMTVLLKCGDIPANITGYAIGIISSYFFNKQWTFKSAVSWKQSAIRFFVVCAICYLVQFTVFLSITRYCPNDPPLYEFFKPLLDVFKLDVSYYIHMFAMVFYTLLNFIANKFYTFKA